MYKNCSSKTKRGKYLSKPCIHRADTGTMECQIGKPQADPETCDKGVGLRGLFPSQSIL